MRQPAGGGVEFNKSEMSLLRKVFSLLADASNYQEDLDDAAKTIDAIIDQQKEDFGVK